MATEIEIHGIIDEVFLRQRSISHIQVNTDLLKTGVCDSLGIVILVSELEKRYPGLRVMDQEIKRDNFGSIERILTFLKEKGF